MIIIFKNHSFLLDDFKRADIKEINAPPLTCQLIIQLKSSKSGVDDIYQNYEKIEDAQKDFKTLNDDLKSSLGDVKSLKALMNE